MTRGAGLWSRVGGGLLAVLLSCSVDPIRRTLSHNWSSIDPDSTQTLRVVTLVSWESLFKRNGRGSFTAVPPVRGPARRASSRNLHFQQISKSKTDTFFLPEWLPSLFL